MGRYKGITSANPKYALTAEKYSAMLKSYLAQPVPTQTQIIIDSGCGRPMVKRALETGWPELNLPCLFEAPVALLDPEEVKKQIASQVLLKKEQEVIETATAELVKTPPVKGKAVKVEQEAAAKMSMTVAMKSARAIEKLADHFAEMIEAGMIELPTAIRPEHLFMLAKASDTAVGALHKALASEKLIAEKPDIIAGTQITTLLIGATAEELRHVALTGQLPPRLLGIDDIKTIDVEEVKPVKIDDNVTDVTAEEKKVDA